jgi:hypothetical protein
MIPIKMHMLHIKMRCVLITIVAKGAFVKSKMLQNRL